MTAVFRSRRAAGCQAALALALVLATRPSPAPAETPGGTRATGGVKISGLAETTVSAGHSPLDGWFSGLEQFANVRLAAPVGESGTFNAAANLLAAAGTESAFRSDAELERLYVSFRTGRFDLDAGLMRVPFGYGQAFRPTDILNAANPLFPDARLSGVLGVLASWYLAEETRLAAFASDRAASDLFARDYAPDPLSGAGSRPLGGLLFETHAPRYSAQALAAVRAPDSSASVPEIRVGASLKVEAGAGIVADAVFFNDGESPPSAVGSASWVKAAFGADYSFFDGSLYVLAQYCFNGSGVLSARDSLADLYGTDDWADVPPSARVPEGGRSDYYRRHYLFAHVLWKASDYTRVGASALVALEDGSFAPVLDLEHDLARGVSLSAEGRAYLDAGDLGLGWRGELGSANVGATATLTCKATVRF